MVSKLEILCIGHPRCGTGYTGFLLKKLGFDIGHEVIGKHGVTSWMCAVYEKTYPWGTIGIGLRDGDFSKYSFNYIIHVLRNPFTAIPSIMLENEHTKNFESYNFRRKHILTELGINLPAYNKKWDLVKKLEIAIKTYIYWNLICEKYKPDCIFRIEHDHDVLINFLLDKKLISKKIKFDQRTIKTKINKQKPYNGKRVTRPVVDINIYKQLPSDVKQLLAEICTKYKYDNITINL